VDWLVAEYQMCSSLATRLFVDPATVKEGDTVRVQLTVSNTGNMTGMGVRPVLTFSDPALAQVTAGPSPPGPTDMVPGDSAVFAWTIKALGAGVLTLTAVANGVDTCDGSPLNATAQAIVTIEASRHGMAVYPNPFSPAVAVRGTVKFEGVPPGGTLRLYTSSGQKVWSTVSSGGLIEWNGRNSAGSRVVPGVYWWIVESQGSKQRGKLVVE
jgi:hypothetical protein